MDASRQRRLHRERQNDLTVVRDRKRTVVLSPTVTRRPQLDAMLGMTSLIAEHELEHMRNKVLDNKQLDYKERKAFKDICELVLKQTRLEMDVENHVEAKTAGMESRELAADIRAELEKELAPLLAQDKIQTIVEAVLRVIDLETND